MYVGSAPTIGNEIDALTGVTCEDNLFALARIDKMCDLDTCLLHRCRCFFTEFIDTAMHVSIDGLVVGAHRFNHSMRFLRARCAIKIDQGFSMYRTRQNGKVLTNSPGRTNFLMLCRGSF